MKFHLLFVALLLFLFLACTDEQIDQPVITEPSANNMKILPQNPAESDNIKLVIYDDCTYNVLSGITQNGNSITILKQFNSMMKRPCLMRNDTISVGKLSEGVYTLNYKLLDIATPATPKVDLSLLFRLVVSK